SGDENGRRPQSGDTQAVVSGLHSWIPIWLSIRCECRRAAFPHQQSGGGGRFGAHYAGSELADSVEEMSLAPKRDRCEPSLEFWSESGPVAEVITSRAIVQVPDGIAAF